MRIPTPSDVLIVGVRPVSLAFACLLAKGGVNVLVAEETGTQAEISDRKLELNSYSLDLLKDNGYQIDDSTTEQQFLDQSLTLLAYSLCCVIWGTQLDGSTENKYYLRQEGEVQVHQTQYKFTLDELIVKENDDEENFRNIFVLAWRLIGIIQKNLKPAVLNSFDVEQKLITSFYTPEAKQNLFTRWITKLSQTKSDLFLGDSPINLHLSQQDDISAGELLPDLSFFNEKTKETITLHDWCSYHYFSMIIVGNVDAQFIYNFAKWMLLNYNIKLFYLPFSEQNESIFRSLNVPKSGKKTFIIRPDKYISFINDAVETDIIVNYLKTVLFMIPNTKEEECT